MIECAECTAENGGSWELQVALYLGGTGHLTRLSGCALPAICFRAPCHRLGYESSSGSLSPWVVRVVATRGVIRKSPALSMIQSHSDSHKGATALETLETFAQLFVCLFVLDFLVYDVLP